MASARDTATFFTEGSASQFQYVLSLYPQALKLKAERKTKKPEELIKLDNWWVKPLKFRFKKRSSMSLTLAFVNTDINFSDLIIVYLCPKYRSYMLETLIGRLKMHVLINLNVKKYIFTQNFAFLNGILRVRVLIENGVIKLEFCELQITYRLSIT